jgi:hypothetical protein
VYFFVAQLNVQKQRARKQHDRGIGQHVRDVAVSHKRGLQGPGRNIFLSDLVFSPLPAQA